MKIGEFEKLKIKKKVDFGLYLTDGKEDILLPIKEAPENAELLDEIKVFIYKDSKDRPIATTNQPYITKKQPAVLLVKEVTKIGAFLDWGLPKDLFLPYKEMRGRVEAGDEILVRLYEDKSHRLCASMKGLYDLLSVNSPYVIGDEVKGRVYEFGHDFGTFVAVDDIYSAMIPKHEDVSHVKIGQILDLRVTGVKEDGKLDVTGRQKAYLQMEDDAAKVLDIIDSYAGVLPFTEKASPEVIKRETGLSKAAFKRAVGRLYKEQLITLEEGRIKRKDDNNEGSN
ncbi:MAG: RNA-binding protein [Lachnospiraceae bacterium]|nr:RNA-binding protein [Lachnospiraceae bacterium]